MNFYHNAPSPDGPSTQVGDTLSAVQGLRQPVGQTPVALYILRGAFILLTTAVTALYVLPFQENQKLEFGSVLLMMLLSMGTAAAVVSADVFSREKRLSSLSGAFLGLIGGMVAAYALSFVVDLVGLLTAPSLNFDPAAVNPSQLDAGQKTLLAEYDAYLKLLEGVKVFIGLVTCYIGISMVMQTKDDFRFVIPYVEFAKQVRGLRPTLLDSSVIIDGRITDIISTRICQGPLIVPRFILNELQSVADSSDKLKRARGRRGLDVLQQLQRTPMTEVIIEDADTEGIDADQKLVSMAQSTKARLMTNDFNLSKIAQVRGIEVINLNELAKAMRPVKLPGEPLRVKIIKPGENPNQGVGYLEDGTMVVVENARHLIDQEVHATVTSTLQTSAGRMIFARPGNVEESEQQTTKDHAHNDGGGKNPQNKTEPESDPDTTHHTTVRSSKGSRRK